MHAAGQFRSRHDRSRRLHALFGVALVGCTIAAWVAIPVLWFIVGVTIEGRGGSPTLEILVTHGGVVVTVVCAVKVISLLERAYTGQWLLPRGVERKRTPDEPILVIGTGLALLAVTIWLAFGDGCASAPQLCPL